MCTAKLFLLVLMSTMLSNGQDVSQVYKDDEHIDRGFTARKASVKEGKYVGFGKLIHDINVGNNYFNLDYGFFRSELDGMYVFNFQVISSQYYLRVSLRINGKPQVSQIVYHCSSFINIRSPFFRIKASGTEN